MTILRKIGWILLAFIFGSLCVDCLNLVNKETLNIAVIGAGASGLASAKNAIEQGHNVVIFEKSGVLGGVWFYTDDTGEDKYGVKIHTPMYRDLRTNAPYQAMSFPSFPYPNGTQSYPSHEVVWNYLDSYATHFDLKKHIKYHHLVETVVPMPDDNIQITVKDLANDHTDTQIYDAVFVCSNIFSSPNIPHIEGANEFNGISMHSHDYRKPETFDGKKVLVIGAGASGIDIVKQVSKTAKHVTLSRNERLDKVDKMLKHLEKFENLYGCKVRSNVKRFTPDGVEFENGTPQNASFDVVIYATGYNYCYPFLDDNAGISVKNNNVKSLYKQILNVHHPSMAFIGIPYSAALNRMYDLQVRFALKYMSGEKELPTYEEMLIDSEKDNARKKPHLLGKRHKEYYAELAQTAEIKNIPDIYADIFTDALQMANSSPQFRSNKYVIDGNTFYKIKE